MGIHRGKETTVFTTLTVDSNTLDIDEVNNRVGIGTTAPGTALQIETTAPHVTLKNTTAENSDGGCESKLIFEDHANATLTQIQGAHEGGSDDTKGNIIISTNTGSALTEGMRIDSAQKATFAGDVVVTGDLILDDGGSIKEAGGVAAITIDASGNVTKIGLDSPSSSDFLQWDGAKWIATAVGGGAVSAVANGVDNRVATFSSSTALNGESGLTYDGSTLALTGDLTVSGGDITGGNGQNTVVSIAATAHNVAGKVMQLSGGSTTAGTTNDIAGGDVFIMGGQGKGTGSGGIIKFQIASAAAGSGSSLNALVDTMVLDDTKMLTVKKDIDSDYTALKLHNQSNSANTNGKVSMQFSLSDTSDNEVDAGKIVCEKEASFTSTAGTQDAKFQWQLSHNGTMTDRMELSSGGNLETAGDITAGGNFYGAQFFYHDGDIDTSLKFTTDQINLTAGNINMLKIKEDTQNEVVWFEDGVDVDYRIECPGKAYFFFIDAGNDRLQIGGNTANCLTTETVNLVDSNFAMGKNSADAAGSELIFAKSRHATDGNLSTIVVDGDILGEIVFKGTDGTDLESAAAIQGCVDGTPGDDDMPGKLIFKTTADGAKTLTTALTINASQQLVAEGSCITKGTLDGSMGTAQFAAMDYSTSGGRFITTGTADAIGTFTIVARSTDGNPATVNVLSIAANQNATFTGTVTDASDSKLKTDIRNLDSMITTIKNLRPVKYKRISQPEDDDQTSADYYGFIAQEVQPHLPDIVHTNKDTDFSGNPTGTVTLSLAYTEMVPILTKVIQEQQALIEALTARVTALES